MSSDRIGPIDVDGHVVIAEARSGNVASIDQDDEGAVPSNVFWYISVDGMPEIRGFEAAYDETREGVEKRITAAVRAYLAVQGKSA